MLRPLAATIGAMAVLAASLFVAVNIANAATPEFIEVDDRPLLESPAQVNEARLTGRCAVRFGDELYIIESLPKGYVDYSSWRVRMP